MSESSTSQLETVNLRSQDGVATVTLNRPQALNAWNKQFALDLLAALGPGGRRATPYEPW